MDGKLVLDHGTRMILAAAILLFGIYSTGLSSGDNFVQAQSTAQSAPDSGQGNQPSPEQGQNSTPQTTTPSKGSSATSQESAPSAKTSAAKKRGRKKKASIAPCDASNLSGPAPSPSASNETGTQPSGPPATPSAKDCPPPKVVVRQGGTVEQSIQLAGGDPASQKRVAANELLGSTEANLKKIAGLQLTDAQKDTVVQIRQFVDQSKAALAEGDTERGKTLAWKAQLLSEDLVQPQK